MKILVTGGAGFIGSNFIRFWLEQHPQDSIINLDKLTYAGHLSSTRDFSSDPRYTFIKGDICNPRSVETAIDGADTVVHFAAETHVDRSIKDPSTFIKTNVLGTQVLAEAALHHHIKRFHHVSTDEVFGELTLNGPEKFSESTPYSPRSPYAASKAASDHLLRSYFHTYRFPLTISNCSNNFGPYQDPEKFIPRMITNLILGKKVPLYGDGLYVRDWLHVIDHCRALEAVILRGKMGETYCIGGLTEDINNFRITKKVLRLFNVDDSWIETVQDRPGHDRRYAVDWNKIHSQLGWQPEHNFDEWLEKTVDWYKNNSKWWAPLKKSAESQYYEQKG
jgi:dTDP-glucose 4,6-dehydratase